MALRGPVPAEVRRRRNLPVQGWEEVKDVPFEGERRLPPGSWPKRTREWWQAISRMPHCVLWADSDWMFAQSAAVLHAAFVRGDMKAGVALLRWEQTMGTTFAFRRGLRIRYVDPKPVEEPVSVSSIEDYRRRMEEEMGE